MKFGLYAHRGTDGVLLRVIDGEAVKITPSTYRDIGDPSKWWDAIISAKGSPVLMRDPLKDPRWVPCYASRAEAQIIYGVPDDVEIYGF